MFVGNVLFMFVIAYLSCCAGVYLKFRAYGVVNNRIILSCIVPAPLMLLCFIAPVMFLLNKKNISLSLRILIFPMLIYETIKSFPALTGFMANSIIEITKEHRSYRQKAIHKTRVSSFNKVFWPKVYSCYDNTNLRFGRT